MHINWFDWIIGNASLLWTEVMCCFFQPGGVQSAPPKKWGTHKSPSKTIAACKTFTAQENNINIWFFLQKHSDQNPRVCLSTHLFRTCKRNLWLSYFSDHCLLSCCSRYISVALWADSQFLHLCSNTWDDLWHIGPWSWAVSTLQTKNAPFSKTLLWEYQLIISSLPPPVQMAASSQLCCSLQGS